MIKKTLFGNISNEKDIYIFTLENEDITVKILNYGATVNSIIVPDKNGNKIDISLGYDTIQNYQLQDKYIGAIIGRCANRIGNGKFKLNNKDYTLCINNGLNHLHGGTKGFDKHIWDWQIYDNDKLLLTLSSPHMEEGYPGNIDVQILYTITSDNRLIIDYKAVCDEDTIFSPTSHIYFNLDGHNSGDVLNQELKLYSNMFTVNDKNSLPTGEILNVQNTPMDFRSFKKIGKDINSNYFQILYGNGFDNNWILDGKPNEFKKAAEAFSTKSGIKLTTETTFPGIQFYSGNFLDGIVKGKGKAEYLKRYGFCLEAGFYPNAVNINTFPSPILKKYEIFHHITSYKFETIS